MQSSRRYPLDNSAIIHLAAMTKEWTNTFRLSVTLSEPVDANLLQQALDAVAPRFPTIVAGICRSGNHFDVIPAEKTPLLRADWQYLAPMDMDEISVCATRVLYKEYRVAVEFFHALTDGSGGLIFLKTLIAVYLCKKYGVDSKAMDDAQILELNRFPRLSEVRDDFFRYTSCQTAPRNHTKVYRLTGHADASTHTITGIFPVSSVKAAARQHGVTLNTLLVCLAADSIQEIQRNQLPAGQAEEPVQIMVPINLRRKFESTTLRNFTLFAIVRAWPLDKASTLDTRLKDVQRQIDEQTSLSHLRQCITTNIRLDKNWLVRKLPVSLKCRLLKIGFEFYGRRNSCLSLSNLGTVSMPPALQLYIRSIDFCLSPRSDSPYNCGIITYDHQLHITFSRRCKTPELERIFFQKLMSLGLTPAFEYNGLPAAQESVFPEMYLAMQNRRL